MKKFLSIMLVFLMCLTSISPANVYAANNNSFTLIRNDDGLLEYIISENEKNTYYLEKYNDKEINTYIYELENDTKKLIDHKITYLPENNNTTLGKDYNEINSYSIQPCAYDDGYRYNRTEYHEVSLVGKKVSIAVAATAIVLLLPELGIAAATKVIITAIAKTGVAGVALLPNYLYITTDVYKRRKIGRKWSTKYVNYFYLDAARTQKIGEWTYATRFGK